MVKTLVVIAFYVGAIFSAYVGINMLIWLKKHKRSDMQLTVEDSEYFHLLCQTKKVGVIISFMAAIVFILLAFILSY